MGSDSIVLSKNIQKGVSFKPSHMESVTKEEESHNLILTETKQPNYVGLQDRQEPQRFTKQSFITSYF